MEELQIFNNKEFGEVRSLVINNEPWFVGKDVAEALGYKNSKNAVPTHVDEEDKLSTQIEYTGQKRNVTVINESGLYSLILSSKLPNAKKFKRWVTSEVLPTLRKTGSYTKVPTDPRELLMLTIKAHEQTAQRVDVLEEKVSDLEKSTTIDSHNNIRLKKLLKQQQLEHWAVLIQEPTN
ncbi:MAG: Bro-N domain-containing protein [Coprobacillus cateniformis]